MFLIFASAESVIFKNQHHIVFIIIVKVLKGSQLIGYAHVKYFFRSHSTACNVTTAMLRNLT